MKKMGVIILTLLMLSGCAKAEVFETLGNILQQPAITQPCVVQLDLPDEAAIVTVAGDAGRIYLCDGYEIALETVAAGDLDATIRAVTGFDRQTLTVLQTRKANLDWTEVAWSCAGERGDQVCRAVICDDGFYHYCISFSASAEDAGSLQPHWQAIIDSISIQ